MSADRVSIEQVMELFRQIEPSRRVNAENIQRFLENPDVRARALHLDEFKRLVTTLRSCWRGADCHGWITEIRHYPHEGGWRMLGYTERQWIYAICGQCRAEISIVHLGIPQDIMIAP